MEIVGLNVSGHVLPPGAGFKAEEHGTFRVYGDYVFDALVGKEVRQILYTGTYQECLMFVANSRGN